MLKLYKVPNLGFIREVKSPKLFLIKRIDFYGEIHSMKRKIYLLREYFLMRFNFLKGDWYN